MADIFDEFQNALEEAGIAQEDLVSDTDIIGKLGEEIKTKFKLESEIASLEAQLKEKQEQLTQQDREVIPKLIEAAGLSEITTKDGFKVTVKTEYRGNISEANAEAALNWFIKSGGADTVKNSYIIPISIADKEVATQLEQILKKCGLDYSRKLNIAWNTLAGVIKELDVENKLEGNLDFELVKEQNKLSPDLTLAQVLGAYKYKTTKVTKPKKKK